MRGYELRERGGGRVPAEGEEEGREVGVQCEGGGGGAECVCSCLFVRGVQGERGGRRDRMAAEEGAGRD